MIWLVSFPNSGSLFFQNILKEKYGVSSVEYIQDELLPENKSENFIVVNSHITRNKLACLKEREMVILLVRDGRDCIIANSKSNKTIAYNNFNIREDIQEFIITENDSNFGGWSQNIESWLNHADIVIRYEELVKDPKGNLGSFTNGNFLYENINALP